ncbi:unnamed protein product [Symbiodinium necroappetens]|uniref:Uncharacterized protein n=1 Tax=Symbiodinium necroappetens TaxID=1628268 RepID=A0A813AYE9_9DINO|nr:unnamed protein product [Symbiodinium necroappetens]
MPMRLPQLEGVVSTRSLTQLLFVPGKCASSARLQLLLESGKTDMWQMQRCEDLSPHPRRSFAYKAPLHWTPLGYKSRRRLRPCLTCALDDASLAFEVAAMKALAAPVPHRFGSLALRGVARSRSMKDMFKCTAGTRGGAGATAACADRFHQRGAFDIRDRLLCRWSENELFPR